MKIRFLQKNENTILRKYDTPLNITYFLLMKIRTYNLELNIKLINVTTDHQMDFCALSQPLKFENLN